MATPRHHVEHIPGIHIYPKVVVFGLDGTVWSGSLNENEFGKKGFGRSGSANTQQQKESCIGVVSKPNSSDLIIGDRRNSGHKPAWVTVARDFTLIIAHLRQKGVAIGIATKNSNRKMCRCALSHIIDVESTDNTNVVVYFCGNKPVRSKLTELDQIQASAKKDRQSMLLFDDKAENMDVEQWSGASFYKIANSAGGITWEDYKKGLKLFSDRSRWQTEIPIYGILSSQVRHIGYIGAGEQDAKRYARGERCTKTDRPGRYGFAMYVTDDPKIAMHYARAGRRLVDQFVVRLYVRDYDAFKTKMAKVWLPESPSWQINSKRLDQAKIAERQVELDEKVQKEFRVTKPYLAFCKHRDLEDKGIFKRGERFNELVVYPQLQDAMFFGEAYYIAKAEDSVAAGAAGWKHLRWNHNVRSWGIRMIEETRNDFRHGELWK